MLMKTGFQIVALACCLLAAQGSPDTPCFTRELCSAPCYACSTPLNGVLCLNQSDLAEASDLACMAVDKPKPAPGPQPGPPPQCASLMEEKACLKAKDVECSWCVSKFTPGGAGTCFAKDQAKFLPPSAYECKDEAANTLHKDDPKPTPEPPAPEPPAPEPKCADLATKKSCLKGKPDDDDDDAVGKKKHDKKKGIECDWCTNKYVPGGGGACYDPETAKGLPPFVFDCEAGKKVEVV